MNRKLGYLFNHKLCSMILVSDVEGHILQINGLVIRFTLTFKKINMDLTTLA